MARTRSEERFTMCARTPFDAKNYFDTFASRRLQTIWKRVMMIDEESLPFTMVKQMIIADRFICGYATVIVPSHPSIPLEITLESSKDANPFSRYSRHYIISVIIMIKYRYIITRIAKPLKNFLRHVLIFPHGYFAVLLLFYHEA